MGGHFRVHLQTQSRVRHRFFLKKRRRPCSCVRILQDFRPKAGDDVAFFKIMTTSPMLVRKVGDVVVIWLNIGDVVVFGGVTQGGVRRRLFFYDGVRRCFLGPRCRPQGWGTSSLLNDDDVPLHVVWWSYHIHVYAYMQRMFRIVGVLYVYRPLAKIRRGKIRRWNPSQLTSSRIRGSPGIQIRRGKNKTRETDFGAGFFEGLEAVIT